MERATLLQRLRIDRRLLWLAGAALALIVGELSLRGWETHQRIEKELRTVRARASLLTTSSDLVDWAARIAAAEAERDVLQARLWQSPSEAQAQARLRDWLVSALRSATVARPVVSLLPLQVAPAASGASGARPALRVRAAVNFDLAPNTLEKALVEIEAGGQLARIDSLSVAARNRRVEMTVSVPVLLQPEVAR